MMLRKLRSVAMLLVITSIVACGTEAPLEPENEQGNVGPDGATLSLADGRVTVVVPPGALSESITITAQQSSTFPSSGLVLPTAVYEFGPAGTQFAQPVEVTIAYLPADLPAGVDESELRLARAGATSWSTVSGSGSDEAGNEVSGEVTSFSVLGARGADVQTVLVSPTQATIDVSEPLQLSAAPVLANGDTASGRPVAWSSSNESIVQVDASGLAEGIADGLATVTATSEGASGAASITVGSAVLVPSLELLPHQFKIPVHVTAPPGDVSRIFVVDKDGDIWIIKNGTLLSTPFLSLQGIITKGAEQGLLSMAFHPNYATNGEFFVDYSIGAGDSKIERYRVSGNPDIADANSGTTVLDIVRSGGGENHNGGLVVFGPDGMLYIGTGDANQPNAARDNTRLLGKILRIDVDGGTPYAIPSDNPYAGHPTARGEIWVSGLRNPWRFAFDPQDGHLFIADVGEQTWEEIDIQVAGSGGGEDYGWPTLEGPDCFSPSQGCDPTGTELPILSYKHPEGCSVTGGVVYRGTQLPFLDGHFLYGDFCGAFVRSFRWDGSQVVDQQSWPASAVPPGALVTGFGLDGKGDLYITQHSGEVYRVIAAPSS